MGIQYVVGIIFYILFNLFFSSANNTHKNTWFLHQKYNHVGGINCILR